MNAKKVAVSLMCRTYRIIIAIKLRRRRAALTSEAGEMGGQAADGEVSGEVNLGLVRENNMSLGLELHL
jgi:hypothetical protein